jgi:hypothetical protein
MLSVRHSRALVNLTLLFDVYGYLLDDPNDLLVVELWEGHGETPSPSLLSCERHRDGFIRSDEEWASAAG